MKHQDDKQKKTWPREALPFLAVLALLTVAAFILPLRPERSYTEKRELAKFPAFSVAALLSGEYFDGINAWFSDTFPGRELWISANVKLEQLHGISDVKIYGELPMGNTVPTAVPSVIPEPTPTALPEPTPEPTIAPVVETTPPESSVEEWGGVIVDEAAEVIFGTTLQIGDAAYGYFNFLQGGCDTYAGIISGFADAMVEKGVEVYCMPTPTSVGVMVSSAYQETIRCSDQGAAIAYTLGKMSDNVKKVNIFNNLVAHNDEYIFFRTDHHWTALGAYYAYETLCASAGMKAAALEDFELWDQGEFLGSFYYSCNQNSRLRTDRLYAYDPPGDLEMKITNVEGNTFPWTVLTDMSKNKPSSKYMTFLAGDYPVVAITNKDLPDAPVAVLVKDSYGNHFAPFLTQNYSKVYVLDYRSYHAMGLKAFVEAYGVDQVIFAQNIALAETEGTIGLTRRLCW